MHKLTILIPCLLGMSAFTQAAVVAVLDHKQSQGSKGIIETLRQEGSHEVKVIPEIAAESLKGADVLIVAHKYNFDHRDVVRKFVRQGGGVLMTHDAVGSGQLLGNASDSPKAESTFPEISATSAMGYGPPPNPRIRAVRRHPITEGIDDTGYNYTWWTHTILCPVDDRMVLMEDTKNEDGFFSNRFRGTQVRWNTHYGGNAVLLAAPFGQGRIVLNSLMVGQGRNHKPAPLHGGERTILLNSVNWLAGTSPLGVPKTVEASAPSKYARWILQETPGYREKAVFVETRTVDPGSHSGGNQRVRFQLPDTVSPGRSVPVVMDVPPGRAPQAVSIIRSDGTAADSVPVQVEKRDDGKEQLVFLDRFPARDVTALFDSQETLDATHLEVKLNAEGSLAEVTGPHFSLLVGCEGDEPTLQWVRVHDWDWHHTWDGLERNNLSAPVLRLAESLRPFRTVRPSADHELGTPFPEVHGDAARTFRFPVRVTLRVGAGRLTVYRTGQIHLENFSRTGRIATFLVDRYLSKGKEIPETASYDLPAVRGQWVWAQRDHRYALGGTFQVLDKMGETGLAPGLERQLLLSGESLVVTTDIADLARYQVPAVACSVTATVLPAGKQLARSEPRTPLTHPTIRASQRKLWKMRGTDEFFDILPEPVEIYRDLLAGTPAVAQWEIRGDDNVLIGPAMTGPFGNTVQDSQLVERIEKADPRSEDSAVWRRVYLRCQDITDLKTTQLTLRGTDNQGETVIAVPIEFHQALSLPLGVFTYGPQWVSYWQWAGKDNGRMPPDQWPKVIRCIAMSNLDYAIHSTHEEEPDGPTTYQSRLERYGLWWMASVMQAYKGVNNLWDLDEADKQHLDQWYSEKISRWGDAPNIIAWYLSDEITRGEYENGVLPGSYHTVSYLYDTCKRHDKMNRPAINLLTLYHTSYETSTQYLPSDAYSWDPYGLGASDAYRTAAKVDTMWRNTKNKPSWITLRCCGPTWYDCLDLWFDVRRRSLASVRGNVDSINFFGYSHWLSDMELHGNAWYAVLPGTQGPIATPRWEAVHQVVRDIELLTTAEYLVDRQRRTEKDRLVRQLDKAKLAGQDGKFFKMRTLLHAIIRNARPK